VPGVGTRLSDAFDLQAHRGGLGLTVENTLAAFRTALAVGVTTLECDVHITSDGVAVVTHDRRIGHERNRDTGPAYPGDPDFPYVGRLVRHLTLAQVRTLDVGSGRHPEHPGQRLDPGARIPTLEEAFALLEERGADDVEVNLETKFEVVAPAETEPRERFVDVVTATVERARMAERVSVQSYDWGMLRLIRERAPKVRLNALTGGHYLEVGQPGGSPWMDGLDIDDFGGNLVRAAASRGMDAVSPVHGSPYTSGVGDPAYRPFVTAAMVDDAHDAGMRVLPYTVDDPATMRALLELRVDGLITNYPDRLRGVLADEGIPLPPAYPG
jgi:glycerophosphoryl diester phosphodiesterase